MQSNYLMEKPLGYVQITNLTAAVGVGAIPAGTALALITCETQAVRWRDDGVNPTAAVGYPLPTTAELQYTAAGLAALKFIEQAASAKLNIAFYGSSNVQPT